MAMIRQGRGSAETMRIAGLLLGALAIAAPGPAEAQTAPPELRRRMDAFVTALAAQEPMEKIAGFFPRQAQWELVQTPHRVAPGAAVGRHRFAPGQTLAAISEGGPVCDSFGGVVGDVGAYEGTLVMQAARADGRWSFSGRGEGRWRYAGHGRFVPPGARRDWHVYVQWTREHGTWVIERIGEEYWYQPRTIGDRAWPRVTRDTAAGRELPMERRYGSRAGWFVQSGPITLGEHHYVKYGLPRTLAEGDVIRFGSVGVVPVFVEPAANRRTPEVVYVLAGPNLYQPYQGFGHSICRD
jgi:hypothetical protein